MAHSDSCASTHFRASLLFPLPEALLLHIGPDFIHLLVNSYSSCGCDLKHHFLREAFPDLVSMELNVSVVYSLTSCSTCHS